MRIDTRKSYNNASVLITGGCGFLGRNLAGSLSALGASVTVTDIREPASSLPGDIEFERADMLDSDAVSRLITGRDYVFALAGLSGVAESNDQPLRHMEINCGSHVVLLEACRRASPGIRVFLPSSQLVYGRGNKLPVGEDAPLRPRCVYGIHKLALEHHYRLYHELYGLGTSCLRISNPFGPGQAGEQPYGIVNNFVIKALRSDQITLYGGGTQVRDFIYVDDVVSAMAMTAASEAAFGQVFNCGGPAETTLAEMAELIIGTAGSGSIERVAWPADAGLADVGDIFLDKTALLETVGWSPSTSLTQGIRQTVEHYDRD